jgi:transposase
MLLTASKTAIQLLRISLSRLGTNFRVKTRFAPTRILLLLHVTMALQPLNDSALNRRKGHELTSYDRGQIVAEARCGRTMKQIATRYKCDESTVRKTIKKVPERQDGKSKRRTGAPRKHQPRDDRHIISYARRNPFTSLAEIIEILHLKFGANLVRAILDSVHISTWLAKKRPKLTPRVARLRLQWARIHVKWTEDQWIVIIFSDECSVGRGKGKRRPWVLRTPQQKWDQDKVIEDLTSKQMRVMVWAGICGNRRSKLVTMPRDSTSDKKGFTAWSYCEALDEGLLPWIQPGEILQQDNAKIHTAKKTTQFLRTKNIPTLTGWPPYSPDLNCIEHMWPPLKDYVTKNHPELEDMGTGEEDRAYMEQVLVNCWPHCGSQDLVSKLVGSMKAHCEAVIAAQGWHTSY